MNFIRFILLLAVIYSSIGNLFCTDNSAYIVTSKSGLILREGPGTQFNKITVIPFNAKVIVNESNDNSLPSTPESFLKVEFKGKKIYYEGKKKYYNGTPLDKMETAYKIADRYGYWIQCRYNNYKGWAFSGFMVKENVMNKIENMDVLKTIPQIWVPLSEDGGVQIIDNVNILFAHLYPDGFYSDGYPCITISYTDTVVFLIKEIEVNDYEIILHTEVYGNESIFSISRNNFEMDKKDVMGNEKYVDIYSALNMPVNIYKGDDDSPP